MFGSALTGEMNGMQANSPASSPVLNNWHLAIGEFMLTISVLREALLYPNESFSMRKVSERRKRRLLSVWIRKRIARAVTLDAFMLQWRLTRGVRRPQTL